MHITELKRLFSWHPTGSWGPFNHPKRLLSALCLCGLASGTHGQGLIQLTNDFSTLVTLNVPGMPPWPHPGSLLFGLVTTPTWTTDYRPTLVLATNLPTQGLVGGGVIAVPGWQVGEPRSFTIVGWSAYLGTNFNPAWLQGQACLVGVGVSQTGAGSPGGIDPVTGRTLPPLNPFQAIHSGLVLYGPLSPEFCPAVTPPTSQYALVGSTVVFNAFASWRSQPLPCQWQFNGANLPGATKSTLVLTNVDTSMAGAYSVYVENGWAGVSSGLAMLVVGGPPTIRTPPQSQTANAGSTVDFTVIADGTPPLAYNWFFNGTNLPSGSTGPVLELTNVQSANAGAYSVVVGTPLGAVTSSPALLTVAPSPPNIVQPPRHHKANVGWSLDFTVSARGSIPLGYQWFFNGNAIPGASNDDLHLSHVQLSQSGPYTVLVTNAFGAVTSTPAVLSMPATPTNQPSGTVVAWGDLAIPYVAPGTRFTAIAAGPVHSLALKADGTVVAWGYEPGDVPVGLSNVIAIAGGGRNDTSRSLALKSDGTVVEWGTADYFCGEVPAGPSGVIAISTGGCHSLAIRSNHTVVAWGDNSYGQTNVPAGLSGVVAIAAGAYYGLSLKSDGAVAAWGDNSSGECEIPGGLNGVVGIAAGWYHSLALKSDGTVVAWGGPNLSGEISVPQGLNGVIAIAANGNHSLALKSDGTVVPWGDSYSGEANVPVDLTNVVAIAAGASHNLALQKDGKIVAWGDNGRGQCMVPGALGGVIALASGGWMPGQHLALRTDGTVVAWGWLPTPWMPANLNGVSALAAGESHDLALKSDGTVILWGDGSYGQTNAPAGLSNVLAIAAGRYHSLAVESEGTVIAWGRNDYGQIQVPCLSSVTSVAGGELHSLALRSDGTVVAWGDDSFGQSVVPTGLSGVAVIAAAGFHSLALKSDGTVAAWGDNSYGQSDVPGGLNNVVGIAAGSYHSLALKSDGTVVAWGDDYYGQSTVPVGLPRVIKVVGAGLRSLALVAEPPSLLTSAATQTAEIGSTVWFRVSPSGYSPLFYQWFFDGTNLLSGATNSVLELADVGFSQMGSYTVVITNISGAVTSAPAMLSVIAPIERKMVSALTLLGQPGSALNLEDTYTLGPSANWAALDNVALTNTSQWYFDLSTPLPPQRFYRAWQLGPTSVAPALDLHLVPALTLTGAVGKAVRVDYINQFGPTDAWVTLDTVTLTNTSRIYIDLSAIGQPPRLWRVMPVP